MMKNKELAVKNGIVLLPGGEFRHGEILIEERRIQAVISSVDADTQIDAGAGTCCQD